MHRLFFPLFAAILCSCSIYKPHHLTQPAGEMQRTWVYLHSGEQDYALYDLSISADKIAFALDSITFPRGTSYSDYKRQDDRQNEIHLFSSKGAMEINRVTIDDQTFSRIKPEEVKNVFFYSPGNYWKSYNREAGKAIKSLRLVMKQDNQFYSLTDFTFTSDSLFAYLQPYSGDTTGDDLQTAEKTILLETDLAPTSAGYVQFPLSLVKVAHYRFIDVESSFLASTGLIVAGSAALWIPILLSIDDEELSGR